MEKDIERIPFDRIESLAGKKLKVVGPESLDLFLASSRYLAQDIFASKPIPPFDTSEKDGFAVRSKDLKNASAKHPVKLRVVGVAKAGEKPRPPLVKGDCVRIFTGAYLPLNADVVVMQEEVSYNENEDIVEFNKPVDPGTNIFKKGSDIKDGELLFSKGHLLYPEDIYLLASAGISKVSVLKKLKVGVLATGDELTSNPNAQKDGFVLDVNRPVLLHHLELCGYSPQDAGLARDDVSDISTHIKKSIHHLDALITTGGSSVGKVDMVSESLRSIGAHRVFHGVKLRPSSTAGLSIYDSKPIFILSGLTQSCLVALYAIVIPTLRKMTGLGFTFNSVILTKLDEDFRVRGETGFKRAVWVRVQNKDGTLRAIPSMVSSHSRSILHKCHGFFIGDSGSLIKKGTVIPIIILRNPERG